MAGVMIQDKGTGSKVRRQKRGTSTFGEYRFRRYQALSDALEIYFDVLKDGSWMAVADIVEAMEWSKGEASIKRARRICYALMRVGRVERNKAARNGNQFLLTYWRRVSG